MTQNYPFMNILAIFLVVACIWLFLWACAKIGGNLGDAVRGMGTAAREEEERKEKEKEEKRKKSLVWKIWTAIGGQ